jgi:predicted AAA+ superfamily ATPase
MERFIEQSLKCWANKDKPKPLILRGARQVGKTYLVDNFGQTFFKNYIKINCEYDLEYLELFEKLKIKQILESISIKHNLDIEAGKTLIFVDEIQECPKAIQCLRYFYEEFPGLHIIAAGSLLEFVINSSDFKFPVGRVSFLYLSPMSFYEFLKARHEEALLEYLSKINLETEFNKVIHQKLLDELRYYFLVGGMPEAVKNFIEHEKKDIDGGIKEAFNTHNQILQTYKSDFGKYAKNSKISDLDAVLSFVPQVLGHKFKYSKVYPEARSDKIREAFYLLNQAGLIKKISRTNGEMPLGAGVQEKHFKAILLDLGLAISIYDLKQTNIFSANFLEKIKGGLAEQYVGQELLALRDPEKEPRLYFWERESKQSSAEVDYIMNINDQVLAIEVKSGALGKLKSLQIFMEKFDSPLGVRLSTSFIDYDKQRKILSVPLYAIAELERLVAMIL